MAVTYFRPDERKSGGTYLTDIGVVKKIDPDSQFLIMESGVSIAMSRIREIELLQ